MSDDYLTLSYRNVTKKITKFISDQVDLRKKNGVVIGLSGGLDSSVCVVLASKANENNNYIDVYRQRREILSSDDILSTLPAYINSSYLLHTRQ